MDQRRTKRCRTCSHIHWADEAHTCPRPEYAADRDRLVSQAAEGDPGEAGEGWALCRYYDLVARGVLETDALACARGQRIVTGASPGMLRWAACGAYRVIAYAEGGYAVQVWLDGLGWSLPAGGAPDRRAWAALVAALGLKPSGEANQ